MASETLWTVRHAVDLLTPAKSATTSWNDPVA